MEAKGECKDSSEYKSQLRVRSILTSETVDIDDGAEEKSGDLFSDSDADSEIEDFEEPVYFDAKEWSPLPNRDVQKKGYTYADEVKEENNTSPVKIVRIAAIGSGVHEDSETCAFLYIDVRAILASQSPSTWTVYRRVTQFKRLAEALRRDGFDIPELPLEMFLVSQDTEFLQRRKEDLEAWLLCIQDKYESKIQNCQAFRLFLTEHANQPPRRLRRIFPELKEGEFEEGSKAVDSSDFNIIHAIGQGSFAKVLLVRKKDDQQLYAMKVLDKKAVWQRRQIGHTCTERRVLGTINHPNIIKLHYAFQSDKKLFFVLDYAPGGEIYYHLSRMKKFPENMVQFYVAEMVMAIDILHRYGVVYRDLKPENIILGNDGHAKLTDFGLAKENVTEPHDGAYTLCGTPEYLSPEMLSRRGHGTSVDWWTLGMITYEFLTGKPPWYKKHQSKEALFTALLQAELQFPRFVSRDAACLILALLNRNPRSRLGAKGGDEVKRHAFFDDLDWEAMESHSVPPPFNPVLGQNADEALNFEEDYKDINIESMDASVNSRQETDEHYPKWNFESNLTVEFAKMDLIRL